MKISQINFLAVFTVNFISLKFRKNQFAKCKKKSVLISAIVFSILPTWGYAEVELYTHKKGSLIAGMQLQTATFTGTDTWFGEARANIGNEANTWWEFTVEPSLKGQLSVAETELYGQFSYLYGITLEHDSSGLTTGLKDPKKGLIEQGYVGWRSGTLFSAQENLLDISIGRQDYKLGTGFLIYDGANDGGSRAAWWIGARQSFDDTVIARINWTAYKLELFHLNTRPRTKKNKLGLNGVNIEYASETYGNVGLSYIYVGESQDQAVKGMSIYDFRVNFTPFRALPLLQFSGEYAWQNNGRDADSQGGYAQISYQQEAWAWSPKFIYRYTSLEGDDPNTIRNEGFNELAYGFSDWGTWYQGEITGEHIFGSSNLISHLIRVEMQPTETVLLNVMYYYFDFDRQSVFGAQVTDQHFADEINVIADWFVNDNTLLTAAFSVAVPGKGGRQFTGGNKTWTQFMIYGSYTF